jgi:hypothetical protein
MSALRCPSLHRLSLLLKDTFNARYNLVTRKKGSAVLLTAELDLLRVHHLITRHRNFCSHCKFNEALRVVSSRKIPPRSNLILINKIRIDS